MRARLSKGPGSRISELGGYVLNAQELAKLAKRRQSQHDRDLLQLLNALRRIDPAVAKRAVYVFDDRLGAATWLANPVISLGRLTPLQALADGRRKDVLRVLDSIFYGICA